MTKSDLINQVALATGYDKATISSILETTMTTIKANVTAGENVYLRGFGSFVNKTRGAKVGRNISKSITIHVPAHQIPAFKPAAEFMQQVRNH
ncbi:MAG: integration host factor subunit beta [Paludibacteraceae bacterium]|jgi:DNA-binding protein HU-beta|nr:integration host factor subunit beta [Paludibacteraceae bacterium]